MSNDVNLQFYCFTKEGGSIQSVGGSGALCLPDFLDWRSISVKEMYLRRVGGFPPEAHFMLITCQGESKLLIGMEGSNIPQDFKQRKEREDGIQEWVQQECQRQGIDFSYTPRGQ